MSSVEAVAYVEGCRRAKSSCNKKTAVNGGLEPHIDCWARFAGSWNEDLPFFLNIVQRSLWYSIKRMNGHGAAQQHFVDSSKGATKENDQQETEKETDKRMGEGC